MGSLTLAPKCLKERSHLVVVSVSNRGRIGERSHLVLVFLTGAELESVPTYRWFLVPNLWGIPCGSDVIFGFRTLMKQPLVAHYVLSCGLLKVINPPEMNI